MWFSIQNTFVTIFDYPLSYIEFIGTLTGLISVWLATRSNIWTWPVGLVNVTCFFLIFFEVRLYSDMFLQVYFFVTSIYGWIVWHNKTENGDVKILSNSRRILFSIIIIFSTIVVGFAVKNIHLIFPQVFNKPASYPFVDTFVAVISIIANLLLAQRKLENWILWILADIISVVLYAKKMVMFISTEYFVFVCLATAGLIMWIKIMRHEKGIAAG